MRVRRRDLVQELVSHGLGRICILPQEERKTVDSNWSAGRIDGRT